jgi:hypothetical protein
MPNVLSYAPVTVDGESYRDATRSDPVLCRAIAAALFEGMRARRARDAARRSARLRRIARKESVLAHA